MSRHPIADAAPVHPLAPGWIAARVRWLRRRFAAPVKPLVTAGAPIPRPGAFALLVTDREFIERS